MITCDDGSVRLYLAVLLLGGCGLKSAHGERRCSRCQRCAINRCTAERYRRVGRCTCKRCAARSRHRARVRRRRSDADQHGRLHAQRCRHDRHGDRHDQSAIPTGVIVRPVVQEAGGLSLLVISARRINVAAGATVQITGTRGVVFVAQMDIVVGYARCVGGSCDPRSWRLSAVERSRRRSRRDRLTGLRDGWCGCELRDARRRRWQCDRTAGDGARADRGVRHADADLARGWLRRRQRQGHVHHHAVWCGRRRWRRDPAQRLECHRQWSRACERRWRRGWSSLHGQRIIGRELGIRRWLRSMNLRPGVDCQRRGLARRQWWRWRRWWLRLVHEHLGHTGRRRSRQCDGCARRNQSADARVSRRCRRDGRAGRGRHRGRQRRRWRRRRRPDLPRDSRRCDRADELQPSGAALVGRRRTRAARALCSRDRPEANANPTKLRTRGIPCRTKIPWCAWGASLALTAPCDRTLRFTPAIRSRRRSESTPSFLSDPHVGCARAIGLTQNANPTKLRRMAVVLGVLSEDRTSGGGTSDLLFEQVD